MKKLICAAICVTLFVLTSLISLCGDRSYRYELGFYVEISIPDIPDGAEFVDLLLKIPEDCEYYTNFNEAQGEIYGFSAKSEIVTYRKDGFVSYIFHIADSDVLVPSLNDDSYINEFNCVDGNRPVMFCRYANSCDYEYCRENFKFAKLAYLDKDGNIIGISNAQRIKTLIGDIGIDYSLQGLKFTAKPNYRPYYGIIIPFVIFIVIPLCVSVLLPVFNRKRDTLLSKNP